VSISALRCQSEPGENRNVAARRIAGSPDFPVFFPLRRVAGSLLNGCTMDRRSASGRLPATALGRRQDAGTSLVEALVATAIVITAMSAVGQLFLWSRREGWSTAARNSAIGHARQKLEFLRSLEWHADAGGRPLSDEVTDLASDVPAEGGPGLRPSPAGTLTRDIDGYVDYIAANGVQGARGGFRGAEAAFVRRWAVEPAPSDPANTLRLTVLVAPVVDAGLPAGSRVVRLVVFETRVMK
jgi:hypothetical protein